MLNCHYTVPRFMSPIEPPDTDDNNQFPSQYTEPSDDETIDHTSCCVMFTSLAFAQSNSSRAGATGQPPTNTCAFTFSTGTGRGLTQYCVSVNGNIVQFSAMVANACAPNSSTA